MISLIAIKHSSSLTYLFLFLLLNGKCRRRGRHLYESVVASHECVGESYGLSLLIVEGHVGLVAEPECVGSTNKECECPFLFFHASSVDGEGVETGFLEKEILEVPQGEIHQFCLQQLF